MGLKRRKMLPAEPAEGRSKQVWADLARKSGRLQARGWRVGRSLNVHGSQDWPGLRVDPVFGHGLPTQRAAPPAAAGWRQSVATAVRQRKRLKQRSAAPPRAPDPWAGLRIQAQVSKDLLDHRPLQDGGDDLELPGATVRAALQVDVKHALEQPCPADACGPNFDGLGLALDAGCGNAWRFLVFGRPLRHHQRAKLRVRSQHPMESYEVQPGPGHVHSATEPMPKAFQQTIS